MNVARSAAELETIPRAVAIGTFDGVHRGHQRVIGAAVETGLVPTVVTFDPHPRIALGYGVELLSTMERRLELIAGLGVADTLVVTFDYDLQQCEPEDFARDVLGVIGAEVVVAGETFRFGHRRRGDLELLRGLGFDARGVPFLEGDDFHSAANVTKMAAGVPLDDSDRRPWLAALRQAMRDE